MLVNNAGIYEAVADNAPDEEWHAAWARTLTINLQAAADLCRLAVAHFLDVAAAGGSSTSPAAPPFAATSPQHWHYAASKAAMIGMTKTIARGYAAEGILAFAVAPGFTVSEMTEEYLQGRGGAQIVADIPLGRVATHRRGRRGRSAGWRPTRRPPRPAASSTSTARAMFASLRTRALAIAADRHPARQDAAPDRAGRRARSRRRARTGRGLRRTGTMEQARAAGADPRQHLSRRHLRHLRRS